MKNILEILEESEVYEARNNKEVKVSAVLQDMAELVSRSIDMLPKGPHPLKKLIGSKYKKYSEFRG